MIKSNAIQKTLSILKNLDFVAFGEHGLLKFINTTVMTYIIKSNAIQKSLKNLFLNPDFLTFEK